MEWYYAKYGKQDGPVDVDTLRGKLQSGELAPSDLVWKDGMPEWTAAENVAELTSAPATPPVAGGGGVHGGQMVPQQYAGGYVMPVAPTSGLAVASLVCGILSIFMCYINALVAIPAVICGHMALKQIHNSPVPMAGRGMAIAGLVTGYIGLFAQLCTIGFIVFAVMSGLD